MKVLVVSKSFMVRESLEVFFCNKFEECDISVLKEVSEMRTADISKSELIFIDAENDILDNMDIIKNIFNNRKVIVYDRNNNSEMFLELFKIGVDGYIVDIAEKYDLTYIVSKILSGKRYYDWEMLESLIFNNNPISNNNDNIQSNNNHRSILTYREIEVLEKVRQGLTNKEISKYLYVTDHTIKKHITSILSKLNMKNRKELIIKSK